MNSKSLVLYTRLGCCLCQSLEDRLGKIPLDDLTPPLSLSVVDIDSDEASEEDKRKYTFEVPVLIVDCKQSSSKSKLPRVPPRLKDQALFSWIQKNIATLS